ncbi:hypothetical protein [Saccharibacillus sacchari]|uniref:Uncharacterized protein n=1 Tax=Saccharibacillus sacchari TaxID=456493 RepID=A0ACC6PFC1_9BACL
MGQAIQAGRRRRRRKFYFIYLVCPLHFLLSTLHFSLLTSHFSLLTSHFSLLTLHVDLLHTFQRILVLFFKNLDEISRYFWFGVKFEPKFRKMLIKRQDRVEKAYKSRRIVDDLCAFLGLQAPRRLRRVRAHT